MGQFGPRDIEKKTPMARFRALARINILFPRLIRLETMSATFGCARRISTVRSVLASS